MYSPMKTLLLTFLLSLSAVASTRSVPEAHAFTGWKPVSGYADTTINWSQQPRVQPSCNKGAALYPTHPQQNTKVYHIFDWGTYNHFKLAADSEACTIGSKYPNSRGVKLCFRADTAYYVFMSDLYRDACGNIYRAYWELNYLKKYENMGTLFAKGRTMYPNPRSEFPGDYVMGQTYPLEPNDFVFFTVPFAGDIEKISEQQKSAERTHRYDPVSFLFNPKSN